ncbi:MAG: O-antigen ligase family protein, partial [Thermoleophilia bacterium]
LLTVNILLNYRDKLDDTIRLFMYIAVLHAAYGLMAFIAFQGGINIGGISSAHYGSLGLPSTSGFFQEANLFGAYISLAAVLFMTHIVSNQDTRVINKKVLIAGLILLLTITAASMTRSVWVGMLVVLCILPFYSRPHRNVVNPKALVVIAVLVVSLGLVVMPLLNIAFSVSSGKENALYARVGELVDFSSGSGAGRLDIQEVAIDRWDENPYIGHGVLSLEGEEGKLVRGWLYSSLFQSIYDQGLTGLSMMILIHVIPIFYALTAARKSSSPLRSASLYGLALGAAVIAIASQASSFFWLGFPWIFLGILVALSRATLDGESSPSNGRAFWTHG